MGFISNFESFAKFNIFKSRVYNKIDCKLMCVSSDRGGEFTPNGFNNFFEEHGIEDSSLFITTHNKMV